MSKRTFYKTTVTVEVLHEEPLDFDNLEDLHYMITDGECSGKFEVTDFVAMNGKNMAKALQEQGSDPEFFQLDKKGNDIE